jgi:hypothetical protein
MIDRKAADICLAATCKEPPQPHPLFLGRIMGVGEQTADIDILG